jgi:hypothetical protein
VWGRGELHTGFWCGNLTERVHLENPDVDGRRILRWIYRNWGGGMDCVNILIIKTKDMHNFSNLFDKVLADAN